VSAGIKTGKRKRGENDGRLRNKSKKEKKISARSTRGLVENGMGTTSKKKGIPGADAYDVLWYGLWGSPFEEGYGGTKDRT